jgi:hypothetical protein
MQQQQQRQAQQVQRPSLSAEVNILAVQHQLGLFKAEYKAKLAILSTRAVVAFTLIGLLGGAGLIAYSALDRGAASWGALGLILLCAGVGLFVRKVTRESSV